MGSAGPVPGSRPKKAPSAVPRTVGQSESRRSWRVGIRCVIRPVNIAWGSFRSRLPTISATANSPTAITVKPTPSISSSTSNV